MMILQDTIISFRGPELTFLFKIFPFFASKTFYIGVIAWDTGLPQMLLSFGN